MWPALPPVPTATESALTKAKLLGLPFTLVEPAAFGWSGMNMSPGCELGPGLAHLSYSGTQGQVWNDLFVVMTESQTGKCTNTGTV